MSVPFGHGGNVCRLGDIAADDAGAPAERSYFGATGSIAATSQPARTGSAPSGQARGRSPLPSVLPAR